MPAGHAVLKSPSADDPALAEVTRRLVEAHQPRSGYVFG
jgi:hypothetical protein